MDIDISADMTLNTLCYLCSIVIRYACYGMCKGLGSCNSMCEASQPKILRLKHLVIVVAYTAILSVHKRVVIRAMFVRYICRYVKHREGRFASALWREAPTMTHNRLPHPATWHYTAISSADEEFASLAWR
jgi:hypothetical protein